MAVYFKFSSWSKENYDTVVLDTTSPFISVGELKQAIIKKKKIDKSNQLLLTNAQTNEGWFTLHCYNKKFPESPYFQNLLLFYSN